MPPWLNIAIPIAMTVVSSFVTASFMAGKTSEKLYLMDADLKYHDEAIKILIEKIAKLEGLVEAK